MDLCTNKWHRLEHKLGVADNVLLNMRFLWGEAADFNACDGAVSSLLCFFLEVDTVTQAKS